MDPEDKEAFQRLLQFFGIADIVSPPSAGLDSNILTDEAHVEQMSEWVEMQGSQLLYRASRDGWGAADFHASCDNQGPLEVLEVDILWPCWVARIGVTRSTQAYFQRADRQCTELPLLRLPQLACG